MHKKVQPAFSFEYLVWVAFLVLALTVFRSCWLGDDAYIMLRVVRNLVEGHGMVYNIGERVNPASDTLWALMLAAFCGPVREYFVIPQVLNILLTLGAVFVVVRAFRLPAAGQFFFLVLCLSSKAFIDYATAGLENALMYLLLALLMQQTLIYPAERPGNERWLFRVGILGALLALCRPDALLLGAAPVGYAYWQAVWQRRTVPLGKALGILILAGLPFLAWHIFSIIYYGVPFPNTYYAKVVAMSNSGIGKAQVVMQGIFYYFSLINNDMATVLMLALCLLLARRASAWERVWIGTIGLYLLYIVNIGGDFMSGRFFSVLVLIAAVLLARHIRALPMQLSLAGLMLVLAMVRAYPVTLYGNETSGTAAVNDPYDGVLLANMNRIGKQFIDPRGVADERMYYCLNSGLMSSLARRHAIPSLVWYQYGATAAGLKVPVGYFPNNGMFGFAFGSDTYLIDPFGLADSFLARLASQNIESEGWRIGHLIHSLPEGFVESKLTGQNRIRDPRLARYYGASQLLARGPLFTKARWQAIADVNLGVYDRELAGYTQFKSGEEQMMGNPAFINFLNFDDPRVKALFTASSQNEPVTAAPGGTTALPADTVDATP